ncbi:S8 family serine peptidase [Sodalis sp. C49]|uniref:S8 family serine peptidase n=1 Tax=unclassified Sodalis (in: enterobacteria) TaxID=2636512 RepID=UPI003965C1CB
MNITLDYFSKYCSDGLIFIKCEGDLRGCNVNFSLYAQDNIIQHKYAEENELVIFSVPYPSVYRIAAEISSAQGQCHVLWTDYIVMSEFSLKAEDRKSSRPWLKGKLAYINAPGNYIEVKFYPRGIDKLYNEEVCTVPLFQKYRRHILLTPCFDPQGVEKKCEISSVYQELKNFYTLNIDVDNQEILALAQELEALDYVEYCGLSNTLVEPPPPSLTEHDGLHQDDGASLNNQTPDFTGLQGYLNAGLGVNARSAWSRGAAGNGAGVRLLDYGVHPNHEDLWGNITVRTNRPGGGDHGTAAAGIIRGVNNGFGVTGIAYQSRLFVYESLISDMNRIMMELIPGDIVVLNTQTMLENDLSIVLPIVHNVIWWDRIRWCAQAGAVVIFAGGNGSVNLSQFPRFNDFGDSNGIMIGGCDSFSGLRGTRTNFNLNHPTLNAWSDSVTTTGYGGLQNLNPPNRTYTRTFSGTSSATPMVGGCLAVVQAYARNQYHIIFNRDFIFDILSQTGGREAAGQGIGFRPNLAAALARVDELVSGGIVPPPLPSPPPPPVLPYPAWAPNTQYAVNDRVSYFWSVYRCRQAHRSIISWEPGVAVSLWQLII